MPDWRRPDWRKIVRERLGSLGLDGAAETNLSEELAQHLEDCFREYLSGGADEHEAYRKTVAELDNTHPLATAVPSPLQRDSTVLPAGDNRRGNLFEDIWRDVRYAARNAQRAPLFVLFVVLTLGLGIGANTTMFTLINTVLLNPLPVPNFSELAVVCVPKSRSNAKSSAPLPLSYPDLKDYQNLNTAFGSLAGYSSPRVMTQQAANESQRIFAELVTGNYFSTLGLHPAVGRFFRPEEDSGIGMHPVAVLNFGTWKSRFGGAPDIVGKSITIDNVAVTVVGIAPPKFIGINGIFGPDLWMPATMAERLLPTEMENVFTDRRKSVFFGIGRLRPGMTRDQAQANVTTVANNLAREYPETNQGRTAAVWPIIDALFASASAGSSSVYFASVGLMVVVGIVLLIACSNVANLLLARSSARQQEIAVRLAIGASRRRLIRQLLTESVFLGLLSGLLGFVIGYGGLRLVFGGWAVSANFVAPKLDLTVFAFAVGISLATGFLFGTLPAIRASRSDVAEALKEEVRTTGRSRRKISVANVLLVGQVGFSFLLLVMAALFLRSISRAYQLDPGFQTAHLAVFMTDPGQAGFRKPQAKAFYKDVRERVLRIPEVESASWASNIPLWARAANGLEIEERPKRFQAEAISTIVNTVDAGFFEAAGIPIEQGRDFAPFDQETTIPVAIVNETLAHNFFPNGDAIGKRIRLPEQSQFRQIVGIARTANYTSWGEPPQACVYVPLEQSYSASMTLYVRTRRAPSDVVAPIRNMLRRNYPKVALANVLTGPELASDGLFQTKMGVALLTVFGGLALALAAIGLYGIMAYSVNQRKREIGLRMALGAARFSVLKLIVKEGMLLVFTGVFIGFAGALIVGRFLSRLLYGVSASDPVSVLAATLVLSMAALLACYLPARGASRLDPLVALREG
jgi:predicted permease